MFNKLHSERLQLKISKCYLNIINFALLYIALLYFFWKLKILFIQFPHFKRESSLLKREAIHTSKGKNLFKKMLFYMGLLLYVLDIIAHIIEQ